MTPKDKAEELVLKYLRIDNNTKEWFNTHIAKQCAIIAVDEIIKVIKVLDDAYYNDEQYGYWTDVKQELDNL